MTSLLLASQSPIRGKLLRDAGVRFDVMPARIDEESILSALQAEGASVLDIADTLAEMKARKIAEKNSDRLVLGCDQILDLKGRIFSKPVSREEAAAHLADLQGVTHRLLSAAVIYEDGAPVWRKVSIARMAMAPLTSEQIERYLDVAWPDAAACVGCYQAEGVGIRLFQRIEGDWFAVMGLPLLDIVAYLRLRGAYEW